ncbi:MAG: hypothetical protein ONB12_00425 [candidate division KSB1 bacterium]|nr:hypothetical protein [candidate division KSB1 bacterium]
MDIDKILYEPENLTIFPAAAFEKDRFYSCVYQLLNPVRIRDKVNEKEKNVKRKFTQHKILSRLSV